MRPVPLTRSPVPPGRARAPRFGNGASVPARFILVLLAFLLLPAAPSSAQTTGRIQGSVIDVSTGQPLAGVLIRIETLDRSTFSSEAGRFVLAGLPAGRYDVLIELVGFRSLELESVTVRASRASEMALELEPTAVPVDPIRVEAERVPLIEPEVSATRQIVPGQALRELPVTTVEEAVELTTGVSDGHFRGGRVGQETYLVDGMAIKNQVEAATEGQGLQFSPTALSEIEVITGGFGAEYGSSLSGVVSYTTRRGDLESWETSVQFLTDRLSPEAASVGQSTLNISTGGPLRFLGAGATLFADLQLQGLQDSEPRARGLTCVQPGDADPAVAAAIEAYRSSPATAPLYCPYEQSGLPYQQGDGLIGFLRFDKRLSSRLNLAATLLRNRFQRELYTPELKYNLG
ncbi:MAG: TonB-dependent receptor, partial [Gemmatimonadetes bacterium]|nr:TonB-dependent receptor [Gemmatimonadota bacterium]